MKVGDIEIFKGPEGSDCTSLYHIIFPYEMTVGEFINQWLKYEPHEWGDFSIGSSPFNVTHVCEYSHGEIVKNPLPDTVLSAKIKKVIGSGGWSNSDFVFQI